MAPVNRSRLVLTACAVALLGMVTPASALSPHQLRPSAASFATQEVLDRHFSEAFSNRAGGYVRCKSSVSFSVRRCEFAWVIGDGGFVGSSRVAFYERANRTRVAVVRYRLRVIDEYCFFVLERPLPSCERHRHGVGRVGF